MATATHFQLDPAVKPIIGPAPTKASAEKVSACLNDNHRAHDIVFNDRGFHNHEVHGILSLYASGATAQQIQENYDIHAKYQRAFPPVDEDLVKALHDPEVFISHLGQPSKYGIYLSYFEGEIDRKGWQATLYEYLFKGDQRSIEMLWLFFEGVLHPIIHAGFAIEFEQPALVAEALAMAAITHKDFRSFMLDSDKLSQKETPGSKSLFEIVDEINASPQKFELKDQLTTDFAAKFRVDPNNIEEAIKDNINFSAWLTVGAWKSKTHRQYDVNFFLMHSLNCSLWLPTLLQKGGPNDWLGNDNAARAKILEYKGRCDLYYYIWQRMPEINMDWARSYVPSTAGTKDLSWDGIFDRTNTIHRDDGHLDKMLRALALGEKLCGDGDGHPSWRYTGKDIWIKGARLGLDNTVWDFDGPGRIVSFIGADPAVLKVR